MDYSTDTWKVLGSYFESKYFLTKHHLSSYNDFVAHKIVSTISALNPIVTIKTTKEGITHEIYVFVGGIHGQKIYINKPTIVENDEQRLLYPNEARLRNMTYQSELFAEVLIKYVTRDPSSPEEEHYEDTFYNVKIGAIPIMLHSNLCVLNNQPNKVLREMGECPYDQGGYFVIDGKEKVVVAQERIATNRIFINRSKDPKYSHHGLIRCTSEENPLFPKTINLYVMAAELKTDPLSDEEDEDEDEEDKNIRRIPNAILIESPNISKPIPLFALFRALGVESDYDILRHIVYDIDDPSNKPMLDFLRASILHGNEMYSQSEVLTHLSNFNRFKHISKLMDILTNDVFPNVGTSFQKKALFLGYITNQLVKVCLGAQKESDRDSYIFKRVDISGFMIGNLFRDYYNIFKNNVRNKVDNVYLFGPLRDARNIRGLIDISKLSTIFDPSIIENGMRRSLKGMWGTDSKQGIVQDLSRFSYLGTMSHLRRVNTPIDPTSKIVSPHRLHPSQWGIMCPFESPDGASIGLLKNFAIMCHVTFDTQPSNIMRFLADNDILLIENAGFDDINKETKVFVNNNLVGISKDPAGLCTRARLLKRNSMLNIFTGVAWDVLQNRINIQTEAGRCCRPLYVVEKGKMLIDRYLEDVRSGKIGWSQLTRGFSRTGAEENDDVYINSKDKIESTQAPIEFLDVEECNNLYIAMSPDDINERHTHCEIHPSTILSILTHQIPLVHHNQAPRVVFSGAQGKQAIGMYATNFANRIDTMSYIMHYPQRSLITTRYKEYLNNNSMPNGENLIVAIATYTGYNMEDGIIFNKSAIDRGSFNITYYKNLVESEDQNKFSGESVVFGNPLKLSKTKELQQVKFANYTKLDENGFPLPNKFINDGDAYVGKAQVKAEFVEEPGENIFGAKVKKEFYYDKSSVANKTLSGVVDKVFVFTGDSGSRTCKIRLRKFRAPEPGDKLCSTIAQKGVIGAIVPYEDMPFTKDGIVPDIIINPHAIPSRMTIGQLLEAVLGKTACMEGTLIDGTAFENYDYDEVFDILQSKYKFDRTGNEIMYSGFYGCQLGCEVFIGPTYYQRLKHMVSDKMNYRKVDFMTIRNERKVHHVRSAPYEFMTRQPTHGRGSEGGLRLGNMEFDSIASHGMSQFLHESSMERSDAFEWELDNETQMVSSNSSCDVSRVKTPYSFKLLTQEIAAMGVKAGLLTSIDEESDSSNENYDDFSHEVRD